MPQLAAILVGRLYRYYVASTFCLGEVAVAWYPGGGDGLVIPYAYKSHTHTHGGW